MEMNGFPLPGLLIANPCSVVAWPYGCPPAFRPTSLSAPKAQSSAPVVFQSNDPLFARPDAIPIHGSDGVARYQMSIVPPGSAVVHRTGSMSESVRYDSKSSTCTPDLAVARSNRAPQSMIALW